MAKRSASRSQKLSKPKALARGVRKRKPGRGLSLPRAFAPIPIAPLLDRLRTHYPHAHCALEHASPEQLLFATILSAQCTDVMVNKVTKVLFAHYPNPETLAKAAVVDIERIVKPTGFYKNKARNLVACAQKLVSSHGGLVPRTLSELVVLPGVGRKTANVVLGNSFGIPGMVVDTHVKRISNLLGLTTATDPEKIEQDLMRLVPESDWVMFSHWLIQHGREICIARRPQCTRCPLRDLCAFGQKEQF